MSESPREYPDRREREDEMVQITLEVHTGATRFRVSARVTSIQRAVSIAGARYPGCETKLVLPAESETFFAPHASGEAELTGAEILEKIAG